MLTYEKKYTALEKTCVALVLATLKLRHYMLAFKVLLIARMDPLKYLMERQLNGFCFCQNLILNMCPRNM